MRIAVTFYNSMIINTQTEIKPNLSSPDSITTTQETENLWENPSPATKAMKKAIQPVKNKFNLNQQWDGNFSL
jgi:hypothetical protein